MIPGGNALQRGWLGSFSDCGTFKLWIMWIICGAPAQGRGWGAGEEGRLHVIKGGRCGGALTGKLTGVRVKVYVIARAAACVRAYKFAPFVYSVVRHELKEKGPFVNRCSPCIVLVKAARVDEVSWRGAAGFEYNHRSLPGQHVPPATVRVRDRASVRWGSAVLRCSCCECTNEFELPNSKLP